MSKKPSKKPPSEATPAAPVVPITPPEPPPPVVTLGAWWDADPKREKALELIFEGASKKHAATVLDVHRNTISNWCEAAEFREALAQLNGDRLGALRARRANQTISLADRVAKLADLAVTRAERSATLEGSVPLVQRQEVRDWLGEFRSLRAEERIDSGDNVQRHDHQVSGQVLHAHGSVRNVSFKDYVTKAINTKIIDVKALEESTEEPVVALIERLLVDTDVLDTINEEDLAAMKLANEGGGK